MPPRKERSLWQRLGDAVAPYGDGLIELVKEIPASVVTGAVTLVDAATLGKSESIHSAADYAQREWMGMKPGEARVFRGTATTAVVAASLALTLGAAAHGWGTGTAAVARGSFTSATWTVAPTMAATEGGLAAAGQATVVALAQGNPQGAADAFNAGLAIVPGAGLPEGFTPAPPRPTRPMRAARAVEAPPESSAVLAARYQPRAASSEPVAAPAVELTEPRSLGIAPALDGIGAHSADPGAPGEHPSTHGAEAASAPDQADAGSPTPAESRWKPLTRPLGGQPSPAEPDPELAKMDLSTITTARRSSAGRTAGVYICEVGDARYAIKPPGRARTTDAELMGNLLARELGLPTPRVAAVDVDFTKIHSLGSQPKTEGFFGDVCAADRVLVMEAIVGRSLQELKPQRATEVLTGATGAANLRTLGEIAAFDAFAGNDDRFPLRDGSGNPGNLMFDRDGRVVAIDNVPSFSPMREVIRGMVSDPAGCGVAQRIRSFLQSSTNVDVGAAGEAQIVEGMRAMAQKIRRLDRATVEKIVENAKARGEFKGRGSLDRFLEGVDAFNGENDSRGEGR